MFLYIIMSFVYFCWCVFEILPLRVATFLGQDQSHRVGHIQAPQNTPSKVRPVSRTDRLNIRSPTRDRQRRGGIRTKKTTTCDLNRPVNIANPRSHIVPRVHPVRRHRHLPGNCRISLCVVCVSRTVVRKSEFVASIERANQLVTADVLKLCGKNCHSSLLQLWCYYSGVAIFTCQKQLTIVTVTDCSCWNEQMVKYKMVMVLNGSTCSGNQWAEQTNRKADYSYDRRVEQRALWP